MASCMAMLLGLAGCSQPQVAVQSPADGMALLPLSEKALLKLNAIAPAIEKPVNPPEKALPPQAGEAFAEGQKKFNSGDFVGAIDRLKRAAGFDSENPAVLRLMGLAYAKINDRGNAVSNLKKALAIAGDDVEAQMTLGALVRVENQDEAAILHLRTALLCSNALPENPFTAEAMYRLASLLQDRGYWTAALECYDTLEQYIEKYERSYTSSTLLKDLMVRPERLSSRRGQMLVLLRRQAEAVEPLRAAYRANRSDTAGARLLAEALISAKQYSQAEDLLVELAGEASQVNQLSRLAENLCRSSGDTAMPRRIWKAFCKKNGVNPGLAVTLGKIAERLTHGDEGIAIVGQALAAMPGEAACANALAGMLARKGKHMEAAVVLAGAIEADSSAARDVRDGLRQINRSLANAVAQDKFIGELAAQAGDAKPQIMRYLAGQLALLAHRWDHAAELFQQSVAADSEFLPAYEAIVDLRIATLKYSLADETIDSLKGDDDACFAEYLRGKLSLARENVADSAKHLEAATKARKDFLPALLLLSDVYMRQKQSDKAMAAINSAFEADAANVLVYRRRMEVLMASRQYQEAKETMRIMIERIGDTVPAMIALGEFQLMMQQRSDVNEIVLHLLEQADDDVDVRLLAAKAQLPAVGLASKRQFDAAMNHLDAALSLDGDNTAILMLQAQLNAQADLYSQSADAWGRLYRLSPHKEYGLAYAGALMLAHRYAEAQPVLEKLADTTDDLSIRKGYVDAMVAVGQLDQACRYLQNMLEQDKKDKSRRTFYRALLLQVYSQEKGLKHYDQAQKLLQDWIAIAEADVKPSLIRQVVLLACQAKDYDRAIDTAAQAAEQAQADYGPFISLLVAPKEQAKPPQTQRVAVMLEKYLNRPALQADMKKVLRQMKIGMLIETGNIDEAIRFAQAWVELDREDLAPRQALVLSLAQNKKNAQALKIVRDWLTAARPEPAAASTSASRPAKRGELVKWLRTTEVRMMLATDESKATHQKALEIVNELLTKDGKDVDLLNLRSTCCGNLGMHREAVEALEKVVSLQSEDPMANNNLAYVYAECGVNLEKAEKLAQKAISQAANDPTVIDTLGWVYYKQGRYGEAAARFRQIVQQSEENAVQDARTEHSILFDHAGDVYYKLGWTDKAVSLWKKALELAGKQSPASSDDQMVLQATPAKLKAVRAGKQPALAPLIQKVLAPASRPASAPAK